MPMAESICPIVQCISMSISEYTVCCSTLYMIIVHLQIQQSSCSVDSAQESALHRYCPAQCNSSCYKECLCQAVKSRSWRCQTAKQTSNVSSWPRYGGRNIASGASASSWRHLSNIDYRATCCHSRLPFNNWELVLTNSYLSALLTRGYPLRGPDGT